MFKIELLGAQRGDCLWISYGEPGDVHHVIIGGGPQDTIPTLVPQLEDRIKALPADSKGEHRVELLVVTHIDADHIQGVISLLSVPERLAWFDQIWFNGYSHHVEDRPPVLGERDAERLATILRTDPSRWNKAFDGRAVKVPDTGDLPVRQLPGGLKLTVLGPAQAPMTAVAGKWEEVCREAHILMDETDVGMPKTWVRTDDEPEDKPRVPLLGFDIDVIASRRSEGDRSKANAASIILVAEYEGQRLLLLGDAPASAVTLGLDRLERPAGAATHTFAAVKLGHHGSQHNTSLDLVRKLASPNWLVSTNGATKSAHPNIECLARVVTSQDTPTFYFNYHQADRPDLDPLVSGAGKKWHVAFPEQVGGEYGVGIEFACDTKPSAAQT